jgi:hypothetical protein
VLVVVVEAELAQGHDPRAPREFLQDGPVDGLDGRGLVRMEADGGPEEGLALGEFDDAAVVGRTGPDVDDGRQPGRPGAVQDADHVVAEAVEVDVRVAVNGRFGHCVSRRLTGGLTAKIAENAKEGKDED